MPSPKTTDTPTPPAPSTWHAARRIGPRAPRWRREGGREGKKEGIRTVSASRSALSALAGSNSSGGTSSWPSSGGARNAPRSAAGFPLRRTCVQTCGVR